MSVLRKMKKNVAKETLTFFPEMYTNVFGSIVISHYILSEDKSEEKVKSIKRTWMKLKKGKLKIDFLFDDEKFIDKTLQLFGLERDENFSIAMVNNGINVLFVPFIEQNILPLREDGVYSNTLTNGKIYPVDFKGETECMN